MGSDWVKIVLTLAGFENVRMRLMHWLAKLEIGSRDGSVAADLTTRWE